MTDGPSRISRDEAARVAALAHLLVSPEELDQLTRDLGQILAYVELLQEVDVTSVEATSHGDDRAIEPRPDEVIAGLSQELALREAPSADEGGFRVPAFVDEG